MEISNLFDSIIQDPVLVASVIVLVATIIILVWAISSLKRVPESEVPEPEEDDAEQAITSQESSGLLDARLHEITNQLCDISTRMTNMEKNVQKSSHDSTVQLNSDSLNIDKLANQIESRLKPMGSVKSTELTETLNSIEAKLDGIIKLLIQLTDSGSSADQNKL